MDDSKIPLKVPQKPLRLPASHYGPICCKILSDFIEHNKNLF